MSKPDILMMIDRARHTHEKPSPIQCKGVWIDSPDYGRDFECQYENAGGIVCEDCLVNGGPFDPRTGRKKR